MVFQVFTASSDVWHTPLLPENNIPNNEDHPPVIEMSVLAEDHELSVENNQTMFEHETVNVYVKQLEGIIEAAKDSFVSDRGESTKVEGTKKEKQFELSISTPTMKEVKPFGFNYHDVKQNSQDWLNLRTV